MRKAQYIIVFAFAIFSLQAKAQKSFKDLLNESKLNIGYTAGYYYFKTDAEQEDIHYKGRLGLRLGIENEFYSKEKFALETGLTLAQLNSRLEEPYEIKYSSWYLGTHCLATYNIWKEAYFGMGAFVDFGVTGKQKYSGEDPVKLFAGENGNGPPFSRLNYGLDFRLWGDTHFPYIDQVYAAYHLGLANIEGADSESGQRTRGCYLSFGVRSTIQTLLQP